VAEKTVNTTWVELERGVTRAVGRTHELVVERKPAFVYNLQGLAFSPDSAVTLPDVGAGGVAPGSGAAAGGPSLLQVEQRADGLMLLRNLLADTSGVTGKSGVVVGHTDARVPGAPGIQLSERRAENVYRLLAGEREAWAASCLPFVDLDWQRILAWIARRFGLPCHPGPLDGSTPGTAMHALGRFREVYNRDHGGSLVIDGPIGVAEFEAFYDFYDAWLARMLEVEPAGLSGLRAGLTWLSPAFLGAGNWFPGQLPRGADRYAPLDRRVELVFFEAGDAPDLSLLPPALEVYDGRHYTHERIDVEVTSYVLLELGFAEDVVDALPEGATLTLSGPGADQVRVLSDGVREHGAVHYDFDWLDAAAPTTLTAATADSEETLWSAQVKGDLKATPDWSERLEALLPDEAADETQALTVLRRVPDDMGLDREVFTLQPTLTVFLDLQGVSAEGMRFVVRFSDGTETEGTLGPDGRKVIARPTEDYEISFPGLEDQEWNLAQG
jgi:hypothetical protein